MSRYFIASVRKPLAGRGNFGGLKFFHPLKRRVLIFAIHKKGGFAGRGIFCVPKKGGYGSIL
jgi:hypothetical protein